MKIIDPRQEISTGEMWMLYGETKVGKTTSILQSAPDPLLYIQCEPRSLRTALEAANRPDLRYKIAVYDALYLALAKRLNAMFLTKI